jgi:hypothetical protein
MEQDQDEPVQVVTGLAGTVLTLTGTIANDAKTDVQLWDEVITPLLNLRGKEVVLICPITGLCGVYVLDNFEPERDSFYSIYDYSIKLSKGSRNIIFEGYWS